MLKKISIVTGIFGIVIALIFVGLNQFGKYIFESTECEKFNIHNIELRTGINIPPVLDVECNSNSLVKKNTFKIDRNNFDMDKYVKSNNFIKVDSIYMNKGQNKSTAWNAILNPKNAVLFIRVKYKD